ncbi:P-loop containing nucleoside triphosphate hydrolase protein [Aspergillus affinis]|uniref:P-loop containing nucleoside triphosphate hydrolase protein n=1 Tax=Aspergillus affinis TaxID=1070780 RepID=UPI0022FE20D9|nr:P-loop containing nucleoside triphosphate hydrolase protein [Aspergillus affinis]KAI9044363.1 P-loop containing nucleoside triphosphate hydrolase protein [Aspergillus affinis]
MYPVDLSQFSQTCKCFYDLLREQRKAATLKHSGIIQKDYTPGALSSWTVTPECACLGSSNTPDETPASHLVLAIREGRVGALRNYLEAGIDPNGFWWKSRLPSDACCPCFDNIDCIKLLLECGADSALEDERGNAHDVRHKTLLIRAYLNVFRSSLRTFSWPGHPMFWRNWRPEYDKVTRLIKAGIKITNTIEAGHILMQANALDALKLAVELGSDLSKLKQYATGRTTLSSTLCAMQPLGIGNVNLEQHTDSNDESHDQILEIPPATAHEPIHDIEDLDRTRQIGEFSVYLYYARAMGPLLCVLFLVAHAFLAFAESFPRVWLSWWTQANSNQLPIYQSVYVAFALAASLLIIISIWVVFLELMPRSAVRLHQFLLDAVIHAPLLFFASTDSGITLNRFSQDMTLVDLALPIALMSLGQSYFGCVATIGLIATGSAYMAITIPLALAVLYVLQKIYLKTSRQLRYLDLEAKSPLYSHFVETLDGLPTIRAFGWQSASTSARETLRCVVKAILHAHLHPEMAEPGFNQLLSSFISSWTQFETSLGAIARVKSFVENTPFEYRGEGRRLPEFWPEKGSIDIQDVCVDYADWSTALRDVSMVIAPGEKVGICGRTGSSLILALLRLVNPACGKILIDGHDTSTISSETIRERLIAAPQDPFILAGSIRYNVDLNGTATDGEIITVLQHVGIWEAIETRSGLDAVLHGQPLSQGEQQLLYLARALLKQRASRSGCPVVILDEATSSVDRETDCRIQRVLKDVFRECTVVSVAHRLDTIIDFDRLLEKNSLFRRMYGKSEASTP